jgi:SAM-dependent methyltransferase
MTDPLADIRTSYDTVASSYADLLRDSLDRLPHMRALLSSFSALFDGPVVDAGCGTGHITAYLHSLGVDISGVDLSPGMIDVARREHSAVRFSVGSMTSLDLADGALAGVIAWWSLVHLPDAMVAGALAEFRRVLRPGGALLVGFHMGDGATHKTSGYGGHPMNVTVYRRPLARVREWMRDAGLTVEMEAVLDPDDRVPGGVIFARVTA